jgi:hypothetical protein
VDCCRNYLHTNYAPTSEEKVAIEALCADPLRDIRQLDEEIGKLEEEMARLRLRREELQTFVDDHRMLLSPIRQLSPEVLQKIFVECVVAVCYADSYPVMLATQAPMLLGRVCSSWRRIAYGTAELWNVLHIAVPNPDKGEEDGTLAPLRLEALKDWLGRTGSLPLHISLFAAAPLDEGNTYWPQLPPTIHDYNHIYQYAEVLMEFADRWGSLTVAVPPPLLRPWSLLAGRTLPMLKEFRYSHMFQYDEGFRAVDYTDYQVLEFLRQIPLESVTLSLSSTGPEHIPAFRKDALTYLDINSGLAFSDGYSLANFLSGFVSLRTLHFTFAVVGNAWSLPTPEFGRIRDGISTPGLVTLPCLEKLNLSGFGDDCCCIVDFWHHLRTPMLQFMKFHLDPSKPIMADSHSHDLFARFLDISECSILSISCAGARIRSDNLQSQEPYHAALMPYIRACTQVTDLTIQFENRYPNYAYPPRDGSTLHLNAGEGLLKELFLDGDDILLPRLKNLTLHSGLPTMSTEFLKNLTQSRANTSFGSAQVLPLEHLEIHLPFPMEDSVRSEFEDGFSHAGTKIVVQAPIAPIPWINPIARTSPFAGLPGCPHGRHLSQWHSW